MKKILFFLVFLAPTFLFSQNIINFDIDTWGSINVTDSLVLDNLASSNTLVLTPTATGKIDTLETADASEITFDTLTANVFEAKGTINGYQSDGTTSLYYHEHNASAFSTSTGASGAVLTAPTANTLGGYQLDVNTEQLYYTIHVEGDWDGITDITLEIHWEVNEAAAADGTVDLQLICYYKGDHDIANKTQTLEVAHTITGNKAQFTQHVTTFIINYDEPGNVVDAEDIISFIMNLETDTSECDDIIVNHIVSKYRTTKPAPETN